MLRLFQVMHNILFHAPLCYCHSYVGPFTKPFRDQLMGQEFLPFLRKELQVLLRIDSMYQIR